MSASTWGRSWSGKGTTGTGGALPSDTGSPAMVEYAAWAPRLATHDTSFLIVVGREAVYTVPFVGWKPIPFLKLVIPQAAEFFDGPGNQLKNGDTVRVTLSIDRVYAALTFGPHGSLFMGKHPATLYVNYYALAICGYVVHDRCARWPTTASIWYRPASSGVWTAQRTFTDIVSWWLVTPIYHFSNYAVAFQR
jgi:hypothetical protein